MFSLGWKSDGTQLATVSRDSKIRIFDPRSQVSSIQVLNKICDLFFLLLVIKRHSMNIIAISRLTVFVQIVAISQKGFP